MNIVYLLIIFLVFLLIYTIVSTIIKLSLYLTTGEKYENFRLFIPVILTLGLWIGLVSLYILALNSSGEKNFFDEFISLYLLKENLMPLFKQAIMLFLVFMIIGILIQSFAFFTVNIKLENLFNYIRYFLKKIIKIEFKKKNSNISEIEHINKLYFSNAFIASLLSTILIIFSFIILIIIGLIISRKIM